MPRKPADPPPPHPGATVEADILRLRAGDEIAMKTAATALGVPVQQLMDLVRGKSGITPIWALRLARVLGRAPSDWMAMQAAYRGL